MKIGSLFAGVGGFDLAAQRMGWATVWHAEINPYASAVFTQHFPESRNVGDVTTWEPNVERDAVDLVCGGFPCQDVSDAGRREGIEGTRSGLWREFARLIRVLRPRYVVVENTAGLISRGIFRVLGDLAAIRYDAQWGVLTSCTFGAPHPRERVFVVAYPEGGWSGQLRWLKCTAGCDSERGLHHEKHQPPVARVADGIPYRVDRVAACGNSVDSRVVGWLFQQIEAQESGVTA